MSLVVNKWDLIEKDSQTIVEFEKKIRDGLKYLSYAPILFISALTGQRVMKVLDVIDRVENRSMKRIPILQLNKYSWKVGGEDSLLPLSGTGESN